MDVPICVSVAPTGLIARRADGLGDAEVGHDRGAAGQEHVVGLDVPVNDAALVRVGERFRHVAQHADRLGHGEWAARQPGAQRFALHEGHGVERQAIRVPGAQHGDDVGLLQCGRRLDFPLEPLDADPLRQLRREHLHDDFSLQAMFFGDEHLRHAAATELALQRVAAAEGGLELIADFLAQVRRGAGDERRASDSQKYEPDTGRARIRVVI